MLARHGIYKLETGPDDFPTYNNSREAVDAFFADPDRVREYLARDRIEFYDQVVAFLRARGVTAGSDLADVGCGTGHLLARFDDAASRTGYDFSGEAVKVAAIVCPQASFHQHDIYDAPLRQHEIVVCCETLEHLFHPREAMLTLREMVAPSGALFLTVPNGRRDTLLGHINFWSPESWAVFLEETLGPGVEAGLFFHQRNLFAFVHPY